MAYYECFSFLIRFAYAYILPGVYYIPRIRLLVVLILHAVRVRLVFHAYGQGLRRDVKGGWLLWKDVKGGWLLRKGIFCERVRSNACVRSACKACKQPRPRRRGQERLPSLPTAQKGIVLVNPLNPHHSSHTSSLSATVLVLFPFGRSRPRRPFSEPIPLKLSPVPLLPFVSLSSSRKDFVPKL